MPDIRQELIRYGLKIAQARLVAGAGGNISARDGKRVWMKPSGFAMDDLAPEDLCAMDLKSGKQVQGEHRPTSEVDMHLKIYRRRPEVQVVFHTHSPWASGVISSGTDLRPMFAEFVNDLGVVGKVPYVTPTTEALAQAVAEKAETCDTIFLENHGIVALGCTMKQAYYRCLVVEDAAISMVAAAVVGTPQFLTRRQIQDLQELDGAQHRVDMMSRD